MYYITIFFFLLLYKRVRNLQNIKTFIRVQIHTDVVTRTRPPTIKRLIANNTVNEHCRYNGYFFQMTGARKETPTGELVKRH